MKVTEMADMKVIKGMTKVVYLEVLKVPEVPGVMQVLEVPGEDIR
jgi:hypothetical protein